MLKEQEVIEYAQEFTFSNWESFENWKQYAEYSNDVLPNIRRIAGFQDSGIGTYTLYPDDYSYKDIDNLEYDYQDLCDLFDENVIILEEE